MNILKIFAETIDPGLINIPTPSANQVLQNGLNIAYFAIGSIAVVIIIIAGFTLITSGGDAEAIKKAKNTILYAVIGIVAVLFAFAITNIVMSALGRS
jgi:type IV secretory pathway VirB2 component (pilin)